MKPNKKRLVYVLNWRIIYQLISGILFSSLGIMFFLYSKRFANILKINLLGLLLCIYGFYRILMFIILLKEAKRNNT